MVISIMSISQKTISKFKVDSKPKHRDISKTEHFLRFVKLLTIFTICSILDADMVLNTSLNLSL